MTATGDHIPAPSLLLALSELPRAMFEMATLPLSAPALMLAPRGDGHPVLVLPGFMASDSSTAFLRPYLKGLGYDVRAWELGRNLGPRAIGYDGAKLVARIREIYEETGQKVSLVGWSLGGIMSRQMAHVAPEMIRQVIMLGSPFKGDPRSTNAWALYQYMTGQSAADPQIREYQDLSTTPPQVPVTAIYTKTDGVAAWQNCCEAEAPLTDNIEVYASHCGLGANASVFYAIADRLAQAEDGWKPFDRSCVKAFVYPSAGHAKH